MKTNFKKSSEPDKHPKEPENNDGERRDLTSEEFEDYIRKSGARGSFMIYRSEKKDDELGLDEL